MRSRAVTERATLADFVSGTLDLDGFSHRDHMRIGFEMLLKHDFAATTFHYCRALRRLLRKAGKSELFNQTVTVAFLSLIAERMVAQRFSSFESFASANPDLMESRVLSRWYRQEVLKSEAARRTFVLPDPSP